MKPISTDFNVRIRANVKQLHDVLGYILGRKLYRTEEAAYVFDKKTWIAVKAVVPDTEIMAEKKLTKSDIVEINKVLMEKKYEDSTYISILHQSLQLLVNKGIIDCQLSEREVARNAYGDSTKKCVMTFQKTFGLRPSGSVDTETEAKMESVIAGLNDEDDKPKPKRFLKVKEAKELKRVVKHITARTKSSQVQQLQKGLASLGYEIQEGEYESLTYGDSTKKAVAEFQRVSELESTGEVDRATAAALNERLLAKNPKLMKSDKVRVRGTVRGEDWEGIPGVNVGVFRVGLGGNEALLGQHQTMRNGFYDIFFQRPEDSEGVPLQIKVIMKEGREVIFNKVYYSVRDLLWVNYTKGEDRYLGASEYEQLQKKIMPLFQKEGANLLEIEESDSRQDITYISKKTGITSEEIIQFFLAHQMAAAIKKTYISSPVCYGFIRQNLLTDAAGKLYPDEPGEWNEWLSDTRDKLVMSLALMDREVQKAFLESALKNNYIPRKLRFM